MSAAVDTKVGGESVKVNASTTDLNQLNSEDNEVDYSESPGDPQMSSYVIHPLLDLEDVQASVTHKSVLVSCQFKNRIEEMLTTRGSVVNLYLVLPNIDAMIGSGSISYDNFQVLFVEMILIKLTFALTKYFSQCPRSPRTEEPFEIPFVWTKIIMQELGPFLGETLSAEVRNLKVGWDFMELSSEDATVLDFIELSGEDATILRQKVDATAEVSSSWRVCVCVCVCVCLTYRFSMLFTRKTWKALLRSTRTSCPLW